MVLGFWGGVYAVKMKKCLPALLILSVLLVGLGFWGFRTYRARFVWLEEVRYERNTENLDLTGGLPEDLAVLREFTNLKQLDLRGTEISVPEFEQITQLCPDVEILWDIPFQNAYCHQDAQCLTVTKLSEEDVHVLGYFTELRKLDGNACKDYAMLAEVRKRYPQLEVTYQIWLGEEAYAWSADQLTLRDVDIKQLEAVLPFFEKLEKITLEGVLPAAEDLQSVKAQYPDVEFYWQITVLEKTADTTTTELDFSGIPLDTTREIEAAIPYLPSLEKVLMLDCGMTNDQMAQLNEKYSDVLFVWKVKLGQGIVLRSDATVFAPVMLKKYVDDSDLKNLRYCTELVLIDLGHMRITDVSFLEYMPQVRFLILADTGVSDLSPLSGLKQLQFLELFATPIRDCSPLVGCTALEDLNICYSGADPEPLMQMTWLKRLWYTMNRITYDQRNALLEALPNTLVHMPTYGSTGDGWRKGELYYEMRDMMGMPYLPG